MYEIVQTKKFAKALKQLIRGGLKQSVQKYINTVINAIAAGEKLDVGYRDHQLQGEFETYRECHIQGDLLLIYQIKDEEVVLLLINIGSHSQLFG